MCKQDCLLRKHLSWRMRVAKLKSGFCSLAPSAVAVHIGIAMGGAKSGNWGQSFLCLIWIRVSETQLAKGLCYKRWVEPQVEDKSESATVAHTFHHCHVVGNLDFTHQNNEWMNVNLPHLIPWFSSQGMENALQMKVRTLMEQECRTIVPQVVWGSHYPFSRFIQEGFR